VTRSRRGDVRAEFHNALAATDDPAEPELLPVRLAKAGATLLPVDGVGLSLFDGAFRVPLGANSHTATLAERFQFTQGEGPCMAAGIEHRTSASDEAQLAVEWPRYADVLFEQTPYRAVLSVPLVIARGTRGAIDLFLVDSDRLEEVSLAEAARLADEIAARLRRVNEVGGAAAYPSDNDQVAWLQSPGAQARSVVWVAIGILVAKFALTAPDSLALLRGYSYMHDALLDEAAADLVAGRLSVDELRP
jgi:hypothetical protein